MHINIGCLPVHPKFLIPEIPTIIKYLIFHFIFFQIQIEFQTDNRQMDLYLYICFSDAISRTRSMTRARRVSSLARFNMCCVILCPMIYIAYVFKIQNQPPTPIGKRSPLKFSFRVSHNPPFTVPLLPPSSTTQSNFMWNCELVTWLSGYYLPFLLSFSYSHLTALYILVASHFCIIGQALKRVLLLLGVRCRLQYFLTALNY